METYTDNFGNMWLTDTALTYGDYVGEGVVGHANIQWLEERTEKHMYTWFFVDATHKQLCFRDKAKEDVEALQVVILVEDYGYRRAFIRCSGPDIDPELVEATKGLGNYPVYDTELVSQVAAAWEQEAFYDYGRNELARSFHDNFVACIPEQLGEFHAFMWECYREAMEQTDSCPEYEDAGAALPIDEIGPTFRAIAYEKVREFHRQRRNSWKKDWAGLPGLAN